MAMRKDEDDIGYFNNLFDRIIEKYKVDKNRIFISGYSNGGLMVLRLICTLPNRITAGASFVGGFEPKRIPQKCQGV